MASSGGVFSSPEEVQKWVDAVQLYDAGEVNSAIEKFKEVMPCAKMLFNIGCCQLAIDEIDSAVKSYEEAIQLDPHMAVSYFMIGLVYYSKNDYNTSFEYFEKSRAAMRGNKHIDYSQLGLNYKLYCCEIRTNQASILVKQQKIGKAKEMLLLAIACKAEKRHEKISHSLNMLQAGAGCAMSLFILPRHIIFRPSQKIINQLKKKDYLGKAKVMATENSENIYACFSGLRVQKDGKIPNHVKDKDVQTMLTDIKRTDSKERLKRTPPQKKLPVLNIGKVIDNKLMNSNGYQNGHVSNPPRRPPLPVTPAIRNSLETSDSNSNKKENAVWGSQSPPPRPPPARKQSTPVFLRSGTFDYINSNERKSSLPLMEPRKDFKKPPLPQKYYFNGNNKHYNGLNKHDNGDCNDNHNNQDKNNNLRKCSNNSSNGNSNNNYNINNNNNNSNSNKCVVDSPGKKVHEVEIHYSFSHKIRLKEGLSLSEVQNIIEAQAVPDAIHMCTSDEYGRHQLLTEKRLQELFESNSGKKEIFCFKSPAHQTDPT